MNTNSAGSYSHDIISKISELIISNNLGEFVILIFSLIIDIASILFSIKITFSGVPLEEASMPKAPVPEKTSIIIFDFYG